MRWNKRIAMLALTIFAVSGCSVSNPAETAVESASEVTEESVSGTDSEALLKTAEEEYSAKTAITALQQIDNTKWQYNAEDEVYWQVQISYCENPEAVEYETLGIFVPAAYLTAAENGDGTYTCQINQEGTKAGYTAGTAPIVIPVNTPGYMAMQAPTDYVSSAVSYTDAGFIYVNAGCRGRNEGAPAGVTDLKATVRYIRYNEGNIPGSMERIFTFGMSGGGAQSALMGATGDSSLYLPYLEKIGAVMGVSDAVTGSMCWCPITNLDYADAAYEWNLGITRTGLDSEMQVLSDDLARAFAEYVNELGLKDENGQILTLTESENGVYQAGSYYEYIKDVVEESLNNFLSDTTFPYTPSQSGPGGTRGFGGAGGPGGARGFGDAGGGRGDTPGGRAGMDFGDLGGGDTDLEDGIMFGGFVDENGEMQNDGIQRGITSQRTEENVTYETVQEYIDSLNRDGQWVIYDAGSKTASITSVEDFVKNCKTASKNLGAFDDLTGTQGENTLFGYGDGEGAHFDSVMAELLKDNEEYGKAYADDLQRTDALGNTVDYRVNMYNPMYYLCDYYEGYETSSVARYWRIRTGIAQGDTALSTEVNLALALENYGDLQVDFETVWGMGHTMAERTGDSTANFISWVNQCIMP